jgi:hypothetical protein
MCEFIEYDEYLKLKNFGLNDILESGDYDTLGFYMEHRNSKKIHPLPYSHQDNPNIQQWNLIDKQWIIAPTYYQTFKWLRDMHNINVYCYQPNETGYWAHSIENKAKYDTYEDAQLNCLLEIIKIKFASTN